MMEHTNAIVKIVQRGANMHVAIRKPLFYLIWAAQAAFYSVEISSYSYSQQPAVVAIDLMLMQSGQKLAKIVFAAKVAPGYLDATAIPSSFLTKNPIYQVQSPILHTTISVLTSLLSGIAIGPSSLPVELKMLKFCPIVLFCLKQRVTPFHPSPQESLRNS